jgi:hypothetical protein
MDKVYIAWYENFINNTIIKTIQGVFANEQDAQDFIEKENKKYGYYDYGVTEYTIRY